jgi:prepilin-type N-terminal cleavage/methylation domain-containing protein
MFIKPGQTKIRIAYATSYLAFTLVEVMVALAILALVISGICFGYSQANRIAAWCSMSQAAQAFAIRGMESARAAKWNPWVISTNTGPDPGGSQDELPAETNGAPSLETNDLMDIPIRGNPLTNYSYYATNYVYVTQYPSNPPVRQIMSVCVWQFPLTGTMFTNTIITLRGPDQ